MKFKKRTRNIFIGIVIFIGIYIYNSIITKEGNHESQWANVESAYQRRADLIPNLVATVKGYAEHEKETLEAVIKARSKATNVSINAENITPESINKFQNAQQGLSGALSKLLLVVERYPDLKANQNFLELQSQLEGTENRINVERARYNETATNYNVYIKKIPMVLISKPFGFESVPLFKSDSSSKNASKVEF